MLREKNSVIISIIVFASILACPVYADFFGDTVHTVKVYFYTADYWTQLVANKTSETYMPCRVVFDSVDTLDSVGIRLKGNSSYGHPGNKKSFHLKFNEYRDTLEYKGLSRMTFNNNFHDPTMLREALADEACHGLGVPCSRFCWSVVYYNDTYWGFYTTVDPINKKALTRFFGENDGNLYNCERDAYLSYLGSSPSLYSSKYLKETNLATNDYTDIIQFCNFLSNSSNADFVAQIYNRLDVIDFARAWAVNNYLVNLDSYEGFGRNYFGYFDHAGVFHYIIYDLNMAFGGFNQYSFSITTLETLKINWWNGTRPLASRCFNNWSPFWGLVNCADRELLQTTMDSLRFSARVTQLANLIRPYVYADVNKQYTNAAFEQNLDTTYTESGGPPGMGPIPGLRCFVRVRSRYIASRVGSCTRVNVAGRVLINEVMADNDTIIADEAGEYDDWLEFYNPADASVNLSHWWITDDINEPRKWKLPIGAIIPAHGYMLVWADSDPEQGNYHASFKLDDAAGKQLALFGSDSLGALLCDSVTWPHMPRDSSWGRYPNGTAHWQICLVATPNAENIWGPVAVEENDVLPGELGLSVYPNPFNSSVRITVGGYEDDDISSDAIDIRVFDINGRIVGEPLLLSPRAFRDKPVSVIWKPDGSIGSGAYFLSVAMGNKSKTKKIIYLK